MVTCMNSGRMHTGIFSFSVWSSTSSQMNLIEVESNREFFRFFLLPPPFSLLYRGIKSLQRHRKEMIPGINWFPSLFFSFLGDSNPFPSSPSFNGVRNELRKRTIWKISLSLWFSFFSSGWITQVNPSSSSFTAFFPPRLHQITAAA